MDAMAASAKDMNSKDNGEETKKSTSMTIRKSRRLQGMKMRDEFLCPITYELLREPVVALDGHTYEKSAIEKWLKSNHTSPRSGEIMEDSIISNTNLKKLIQDMINEGGAGLYTNDVCDSERLFDVFAEKVLILKCVGPPESDWNMQSFQVRSRCSEFSFLRLVCY
jgi:U-box domain